MKGPGRLVRVRLPAAPLAVIAMAASLPLAGCPSSSPPGLQDMRVDIDLPADVPYDAPGDPAMDPAMDPALEPGADPGDAENDGDPGPGDLPADDPGTDAPVPDVPPGGAWGWISAIEWNDVCDQWYLKTQWNGGVRAYFAEDANWNRALPHTLGWCTPKATVGACTLWDPGIMDDQCLNDGGCMCLDKGVECDETTVRWCPEDQVCVETPDGEPWSRGICVDLPRHFDVGTVTITGLKVPIEMQPDDLDRYLASELPDKNDLFDAGDVVTATTSGGELPPMSFTARGVAPLQLASPVVSIRIGSGRPAYARWTPADPSSRVQVALMGGSHDPNPLAAAIVCDAPDGDGQVEIAGSLLDELYRLSCNGGWMLKCSRITRYSRDVQSMGGKDVELFVGSARNLQMAFE